ncbi:class I histocompatibility antigen, F10 alpha chain-like isoform 2-T2 [Mantella aurantiaca]
MQISFDDCINLSVPETATGSTIPYWDAYPVEETLEDEFVLCPEEPPEPSISFDDVFQTFIPEPIRFYPYDGILKKSDSLYRDLFSAACFSSSFMFRVVLTSLFQGALSETQSLMYCHTGVFQQDNCPFKFEAMGFVNDQQIDKYDHDTKCDVPVVSWMEKHVEKSYWDRETTYRQGWEKVFNDNLRILMHRLNDSSIFLTLQLMYGCTINKDGSVKGHYQYALNGRDFLYLDDKSLLWQPAMYEAQISADRWNTDPVIAKSVKGYLTQHCTTALEKYISLGGQELNKRVRPEVKVWRHDQVDGVTRLQCLVYGFHPRAVDVKWVRNGVDHLPSDETTPILPHPDGTYQIKVTAEVPTRDGDTYSCHVDHSSLEEILTVTWEPKKYEARILMVLLPASLISIITTIFVIKLVKWLPRQYSSNSGLVRSRHAFHDNFGKAEDPRFHGNVSLQNF